MANKKYIIDEMLFQQTTMNLSDYKTVKIKPPVFTEHKEKSVYLKIRPPPLKNLHTLFDYKTSTVPFQLFHKPRPHIDTDPSKPQKPYHKLADEEKEAVIKTRPRLVMTPAFSLDDIEKPEVRELLVNEIYTSDMMRCTKEGSRPYLKVVAPIPDLPADSNPIRLPKLTPPYVSPEWRKETFTWDQKQLRGYCDTTKQFWLSSELPPCRACEASNRMNQHSKEMCQMRQRRSLQRR